MLLGLPHSVQTLEGGKSGLLLVRGWQCCATTTALLSGDARPGAEDKGSRAPHTPVKTLHNSVLLITQTEVLQDNTGDYDFLPSSGNPFKLC